MNKGIPIIYIHKWWHKYLETSIKQSLKNNKNIIIIWDEKNKFIAEKYNITHILFDDYNTNNFEKYYVHDTAQNANYWFELICFQRRFVLFEAIKKINIEQCLYIDSDILYYWKTDSEFERISKYWDFDLAFPNSSWHSTYIFSQEALQKFCNFMLNCYKDKELFKELCKWASTRKLKRSDMSIFQLYTHKYPKKVFDLKENHGDWIIYDGFINYPEWYKTFFWKKYFTIKNNKAYVYKGQEKLETKTLHFQMHMKTYMWIVYNKQILFFRFLLFFNSIVEWFYFQFSFIRFLRGKWKEKSMFK